jgi:hypothetical protein
VVIVTLDIDDDVLAEAERRAQANGTSIGKEISDLARRGIEILMQDDSYRAKSI